MPGQERKFKRKVPEYLRYLLELSLQAQHWMHRAKHERRRPDFNDERYAKAERKFKEALEELYFEYRFKFNHVKDVSVGKNIKQKLEDDTDIFDLSFDDCQTLMIAIRQLQEHLGHKSFETRVHSEDGVGLP